MLELLHGSSDYDMQGGVLAEKGIGYITTTRHVQIRRLPGST